MAQLRETVRAAFAHYDRDGSGAIDAAELRSLVADLGGYLTDNEVTAALGALDRDSNGVIDEEEFAAWWAAKSGDLDGDGQVGELERAMERVKASGQDRFRVDIHSAAWRGATDVVRRLLENDAELVHDVDATEYGGSNTALHYASYQGHAETCNVLIAGGAKVNAVNAAGCTALFLAAQQSRDEVVALLLEHGADIRIAERQHHFTPVDVCSSDEILASFRARAGGVPCVPDTPQIIATTASSLSIEWTTPRDKHDQIAPISGYKIRATPIDTSTTAAPRTVLVGAVPTQHTIDGLDPDTIYTIQIAAINLHGISAFSTPSEQIRTRPARPPPPVQLRARALDAATIEITWTNSTPETVSHYAVQQCVDATADLWKTIGKSETSGSDVECRFVVTKLLDTRKYRFRVATVTAAGQGEFSPPVEARTRTTAGEEAKVTPRDTPVQKVVIGVRNVVRVAQQLHLDAKRGLRVSKYPPPESAVAMQSMTDAEAQPLRGPSAGRVVRAIQAKKEAARKRNGASDPHLVQAPPSPPADAKQTNASDDIESKRYPRPYRASKNTPEQIPGSNSDEDDYIYYTDSEDDTADDKEDES